MKTRQLILCSLFTALIAVGAFVKIPMPGTPIPFTLQVFFVFLTGLMLEPKYSLIPPTVYTAIGLIGIPVFTYGGGISYVFQPSFGYILGFIVCAFLVSLLVRNNILKLTTKQGEKSKLITIIKAVVYSLIAIIALYSIGISYMYLIYNFYLGKQIALGPLIVSSTGLFIVFDIVKFAIAIPLSVAVMKRVPNGLLPQKN